MNNPGVPVLDPDLFEHPLSERDRNPFLFEVAPQNFIERLYSSWQNANFLLSPTGFINAIDISKWNLGGNFDVMVMNGWEVVVIKASEALTPDPIFPQHVQNAIDAGALILVYHFFRSNFDGVAQAEFALQTIQPLLQYQNKTVVLCDIETADGTSNAVRISRVKAFLDRIVLAGHHAGMYCSPSLWTQLMSPTPAWVGQFWQWPAFWSSAALPTLPNGWSFANTLLWQYGIWNNYFWCPPVPGWNPDLDVNRCFFGSRIEMESALGITYVNDPPPPDPIPVVPDLPYAIVVKAEGVYVRKSPVSGSVLWTLPVNTVLQVAKIITIGGDQWAAIITPDNKIGWSAWNVGGKQYINWP